MKRLVSTCLIGGLLCGAPLAVSYADTAKQLQMHTTDSIVTANIKAKYTTSSLLDPLAISVLTHDGNVVLTGKVPSDVHFERAIALARSVDNVKSVNADSLLVTDSKAPLKDLAITAKFKGNLLRQTLFSDSTLSFWDIDVETQNGVLYLTGIVDTATDRDRLINIAEGIEGVKNVESDIKTAS